MLNIILTILKFAGIGIGILLAILIVLLLLILFVPVRYDLKTKSERMLQAEGTVHWMFRIVTFQILYENGEMKQILRILGVPVWRK